MTRTSLIFVAAGMAIAELSGCATPPPPKPVERDAVGEIIAKYAADASQSLRALSETENGTKVVQLQPTVTSPAVQPPPFIGAYAAPITRDGASTPPPQIVVVPQYYPAVPYPAPLPAAASAPPPAPAQAQAPAQTAAPAPSAATPAPQPPSPPRPSVSVATGPAAATVLPLVRSADRIVYGAGGVTGGGDALATIPLGLERRITLASVTDDVEGIVERIAKQIGWIRLPSTGIRVSQQPLTVDAVDRPAIEVIRDLSGAVGRNAEIIVTPGNRTLSVQFPVR